MLEKIGLPPKPSLRGNNWVVDSTHCQGCSSQFTFINRKHHCRRCGGIFCNSCTQQRMVLRGQGDSPVRICEPCKKLEEAARFELRHGHKNRPSRGGSKISVQDSTLDSMQRSTSTASCSNIQHGNTHNDAGEILRSLSVDVHSDHAETTTPDELRQQAVEEKKKHKVLKAQGKSEEALRAFKRGKELERQAAALELQLRKSRKQALTSSSVKNDPGMKTKLDDLGAELKELGWSDLDLHVADKQPANISLEGELSNLLGEVSQKTNTETNVRSIDKSEVLAHKKRALTLKREGKLAEAKEELKKAKILEKKIEEQEFLIDADDSDDEFSSLIRSLDIDKEDIMSTTNLENPSFSLDHIDDGIGDSNFEVTDDDMYDPDLRAALESMGWTEDDNDKPKEVDREEILSEIQSLKREAVVKKRAGDNAEAMVLLKKAKTLERELEHNGDMQENNLLAQKLEPKLAPKSKVAVQKELLALKKKALALRREGKLEEADEELKKGKVLEKQLEEMDMGAKAKAVPVIDDKHADNFDIGNEEEDVTDQDLNDPSYMSLLKNLGWNDENSENVEGTKVQISVPSVAPVPRRSKGEIQRELLGLKRKSLALRRQGEVEEAEKLLETAKDLEAQLVEMEAPKQEFEVPKKNDEIVNATQKDPIEESKTQTDPIKESKTQTGPIEESKTQMRVVDESSNLGEISLKQEILSHKRKAISLKREGKLAEAKEELKQAKLLEKSLDNQNSPQPSDKTLTTESVGQKEKIEPVGDKEKSPNSGSKVSSRDRFKLQQESLSHKRKALKLRREGKSAEAEAEFELAKALELQLEEIKGQDTTKTEADDLGVEDFLDPQLLSALKAIGLENATGSSSQVPVRAEPAKSVVVKVEKSVDGRNQLEEEIKAEKVKAVNFKRLGKQAEALGALRRAKLLEKKLNSLTS